MLRRIRKYLSSEKAKLLFNAFINSQFNYAALVWMFCRKQQYLKIQKIHHKALKVVYNSNKNYNELRWTESTCCKIDFLRHKFSVIQSMSTLEQLAPIYQIQWIYCWTKNENERSRKYWLFKYFMPMNSIKNKSLIYVTPCGCISC